MGPGILIAHPRLYIPRYPFVIQFFIHIFYQTKDCSQANLSISTCCNQSLSGAMAHLSTCLVLLSSIFLHCLASPIITSNAPYPYPGNQSSVAATGLFSSVPSQAATSSSAPYPNTSSATAGASAVVGTGTSKSSDSVVPFGTGVSTTKLVPHGTGVTPYQATNSGSSTLSGVAATGALRSNSSVPSGTEVSTSNSALAGGTASSHNVLSSPTSSLVPAFASGLAFNLSNVAYTGSFSASLTVPTEVFPSFLAPSTTVAGSAATSEAALLGALFLALQANRQWITDPKLKSQYLDNVKISRGETLAFFNDLGIKPPADPQCSDKKRKRTPSSEKKLRSLVSERNLISGFTDLVGDVAKLLSCAVQVVDNLEDAVDVPVPDLHEIETLTDTLAEIGDDLQEEEDHDNESSTSASQSGPSSTKKSSTTSSSSASSCIGRTAIPHCTETISLSTSFLNGNTASPAVSTVTSMDCTTVTGCSVTGSTAITTASVSGTSGGLVCSPSCLACADDSIPTGNATSKKFRRNELLNERTLGEPSAFSSFDNFFIRTSQSLPFLYIDY